VEEEREEEEEREDEGVEEIRFFLTEVVFLATDDLPVNMATVC
jgi:hypothetical protein